MPSLDCVILRLVWCGSFFLEFSHENLRNFYARVLLPDKVDVTDREIFTDDVTPVVTLGIVPAQPIVEEVVQEGCASLLPKAICFQNSIWLSFLQRACV